MNGITTQPWCSVYKLSTELRVSQGPKLLKPTGFRTADSQAEPCQPELAGPRFL